ncbi:hypothetical protein [Pedobacter namyangjuensis]|uniref:hypothetical protein n=1 Tax=Pedobacter namyangjuensis TaxID=600626 RepID=UPI0013B35F25|nr:hypothetical protein [Pedobacter namyangjuensis]
MAKKFNELFKSSPIDQSVNQSLFKESCPRGYFSNPELNGYLSKSASDPKTIWQNQNLKQLFDIMKANVNLAREPQHTLEDGIGMTWLRFKIGRVTKNLKIAHFGDIKRLIDDYASGSLKVTQSLEDLYNEVSK